MRDATAARIASCALVLVLAGCAQTQVSLPTAPEPVSTIGMRAGGGLFDLARFEAEEAALGRRFGFTVQFTGRKSVEDMTGSAFGLLAGASAELPAVADRLELSITVPLAFGRATPRSAEGLATIEADLNATANGQHDDAFRRVATRLVDAGFDDAVIRLGHEFNGGWPPYSSRSNEPAFIAAWRHVHGVLREVSPAFRFDWTAMRINWAETVPPAYPGDEYVDIVGLDVYWRADDAGARWNPETWAEKFQPVLDAQLAFAVEHGKQVSYPEWGLAGSDVPEFIEAMHQWFDGLPERGAGSLAYQAYFNTNGEFALGRYERAESTYRRLFAETG